MKGSENRYDKEGKNTQNRGSVTFVWYQRGNHKKYVFGDWILILPFISGGTVQSPQIWMAESRSSVQKRTFYDFRFGIKQKLQSPLLTIGGIGFIINTFTSWYIWRILLKECCETRKSIAKFICFYQTISVFKSLYFKAWLDRHGMDGSRSERRKYSRVQEWSKMLTLSN